MRKVAENSQEYSTFVRESEMEMLLDKVEFPEDFEGVRDKPIMNALWLGYSFVRTYWVGSKDIDFTNIPLRF